MTATDAGGHSVKDNKLLILPRAKEAKSGISAFNSLKDSFPRGLKVRIPRRERERRLPRRKASAGGRTPTGVRKGAHGLASVEEAIRYNLGCRPVEVPDSIDLAYTDLLKPSSNSERSCPKLGSFAWQAKVSPSVLVPVKPRHKAIAAEESCSQYRQPTSGSPTPDVSSFDEFPEPPSSLLEPQRRTSRLPLPEFKFPPLVAKPLPPSPPLTAWDLATDDSLLQQRPCTPPFKQRLHILPDTPESLPPRPDSLNCPSSTVSMAANGVTSPSSSANIAGLAQQVGSSGSQNGNSLSSLVCNVNRTTGERPPPLVGASSTIIGDKMYVFGGRRLSRSKPNLTNTLYEIDLITRHWRRIRTGGSKPIPRYFHSMNSLGDTKLVCFGGMASGEDVKDPSLSRTDSGMVLLNDLHVYDLASRSWTRLECPDAPRGRYAHCAVVLPSTTSATSEPSQTSGQGHTPTSSQSGINNDGRGGAQLIVIGGQTPENKYVMEINVFNFRSKRWERSDPLNKEYGAYRSVAIPLTSITPSQIGSASPDGATPTPQDVKDDDEDTNSTLIYSNYNFLDVKLEFCLRTADGSLTDRSMKGAFSPPGLRFPNGDVHADHFILSGTFLTSTRKEYALWALNLRTLTWQRIDVGPGILTSGSWNRGLLWKKRNMYVVFGDRRRKLDQDYNHRRLNFANMMAVELEAYGLYANPVTNLPGAKFTSASSPFAAANISPLMDRPLHSDPGIDLGNAAMGLRELCDLDLLAIGGERIPVNSQVIARRWGPYLLHLLEGSSNPRASAPNGVDHTMTSANGRPLTFASQNSRNSSVTITPGSIGSSTTAAGSTTSFAMGMNSAINNIIPSNSSVRSVGSGTTVLDPSYGSSQILPASLRPRVLYLPHTAPTVKALVHYLYTWSLPARDHVLCTAQILCSLLQIARPYRVDGLLEAVVERLHEVLDAKNTAAVFNAAAMAAGGGDAVAFTGALAPLSHRNRRSTRGTADEPALAEGESDADESEGGSVSSSATDLSGMSESADGKRDERWTGELSSVVGLQKRGLRGLMEGRKMREQGGASGEGDGMVQPSSGV